MPRPAIYQGECQICGRVQKLPHEKLSNHGYLIIWRLFRGTCPGSKHDPLEVSKDLIEGAIAKTQRDADDLEQRIRDVAAMRDGTEVWYSRYYQTNEKNAPPVLRGRSGSCIERGHLISEPTFDADNPRNYELVSWVSARDGKVIRLRPSTSIEHETVKNNAWYIRRELEPQLTNCRNYVKWQRERLALWAPKPLTALHGAPAVASSDQSESIEPPIPAAHDSHLASRPEVTAGTTSETTPEMTHETTSAITSVITSDIAPQPPPVLQPSRRPRRRP